jgi:hypothetical protein
VVPSQPSDSRLRLFDLPETETHANGNGHGGGLNAFGRGKLSELRAILRLLDLGRKVAVPVVDDDGVDLVVDYRHRVQVKSAGRASWPNGNTYTFAGGGTWYLADGTRKHGGLALSEPDFLLCHAVPIDTWWVVPLPWLREVGFHAGSKLALSLRVSRKPLRPDLHRLSAECLEAWHLFGAGGGAPGATAGAPPLIGVDVHFPA